MDKVTKPTSCLSWLTVWE